MKKTIILIILILSFSCDNNRKKHLEVKKENNDMKTYTYFLNYRVSGNFSFYCNGILLEKIDYKRGVVEGIIYLNPLISKKDIYDISLLMMPTGTNNMIKPNEIEGNEIQIYFSENGENPPFRMIKNLTLPKYSEPQNSIFHTWEFEADVSYELENVLENATDLSKEDPDKLLKDVVSFYTNIHEILNNGQTDKFKAIFEESRVRQAKSMYYNDQEVQKYIAEQVDRAGKAEGFMQPMKDYKIEIGLNNKTIKLIQETGKSPLVSVDKEGYIRIFGYTLYRNKTTGKLEVY
ncbi:hypothetical protein [Tenacibaculum sp. SDUM215027]|uniref:hypothetical protein n=1 Tax=Tenacibaculum sp. SDUM215027 TaxID=3422596 RepID=UPI003D31101E